MTKQTKTAEAEQIDAAAEQQPTRIVPRLDAEGQAIDLDPPCGGRWVRDVDGGLSPSDESTAIAAGLAWRG